MALVKARLPRLSLDLEPEPSSALKDRAEAVARVGKANGLSRIQIYPLNLLLGELAANTISYGLAEVDGQDFRVELRIRDDGVVARWEDPGISSDPFEAVATPDLHASLEDRPMGGPGVFPTRTPFPNPDYECTGGFNRITLRAPVKGDS